MNISYEWLKELVAFDLSPEELGHRLTMAGLEVDGTETRGAGIGDVVIGKVISKEQHPQADKLSVCTVDVGGTTANIVCGAPNVAAGQTVPVVLPGAELPGGFKIKPVKLRGVPSEGMICSEEELGLAESAEGIMVLPDSLDAGTRFVDAVPVSDTVYDLDLTPNRPDCFSHAGIAREVRCLAGGKLTLPDIPAHDGAGESGAAITIEDDTDCRRYAGRVIKGVNVAESPDWLKQKLQAVGLRPINNVVDVTNYVLYEQGHPLHAFDLNTLKGPEIRVRRARKGEKLTVIDGSECELDQDILVIADAADPVAVAGVMGGQATEVKEGTTDLLIESAWFDPTVVRKGARKLGLSTDASLRFERGMDPNRVITALDRTVDLVLQVAGGACAGGTMDVHPRPTERAEVTLRTARIGAVLGVTPPDDAIAKILADLECEAVLTDGVFTVKVPTFRVDLTREIDLIEEIARIYGYDNIESDLSAAGTITTVRDPREEFAERIRRVLTGCGLYEAVTNTLVRGDDARLFCTDEPVAVGNTVSRDMDACRTGIAVSLLPAVAWNINHRCPSVRFFETGKVFSARGGEPAERRQIALMLSGDADSTPHWSAPARPFDFYDIKGMVESLCAALGTVPAFAPAEEPFLENGGVAVRVGEKNVGVLGAVSGTVLKRWDMKQEVFCAVLEADMLREHAVHGITVVQPPKFPVLLRDLSVLADETVPVADLRALILKKGKPLVRDAVLFDEYRGKGMPAGKRSLTFSLQYRSDDKTLRDKDVKKVHASIVKALGATYNTELR